MGVLRWPIGNRFGSVRSVEGSVDQQRLNEYQNRVADWIGRQGILFQLRHAGILGSSKIGRKLVSLLFSLIVIALILAGVGYALLLRHYKSGTYSKEVAASIENALGVEELDYSGFKRSGSKATFKDVNLTGGAESFFFEGDLSFLTGEVGLLAGVTENWAPESILIQKADFEIKAGGEDDMKAAFDGIIGTMDGSSLSRIQVKKASFDWGYSVLAYGRIEDSALQAIAGGGKWDVSLEGGTFQQNWLKGCALTRAKLEISPEGIAVNELSLLMGEEGKLDLSGKISGSRETPEFDLSGTFSKLPVEALLTLPGVRVKDYLSGKISGTIAITGSTERVIKTQGEVFLEPGDMITLRDKWDIIRTLNVLDKEQGYRRVDLTSGGFSFSTGDGSLKLEKLELTGFEDGKKYMSIVGGFQTRLPGQKEAAKAVGIVLTDGFKTGFGNDATDLTASQALEDERISLSKAADGGKVNEFGSNFFDEDGKLGGLTTQRINSGDVDSMRLKAEMNVHRIEGDLVLSLPSDIFQQYPRLEDINPEIQEEMRLVPVILEGSFSNATKKTAESLLAESKKPRLSAVNSGE